MIADLARRFALLELCHAAAMAEAVLIEIDRMTLARRLRLAVDGVRCHYTEAAEATTELLHAPVSGP